MAAWLLDRDLSFTISFYRENDCGGSFQQLQLDEQRIVAGMRAAYAVIERHPPRWSLLGALLDRADLSMPHRRTCAVGENYLVIDHHGRIAKCQMTIEQPVTTVAAANPLALIRADQIGVQNVPVDQKETAVRVSGATGVPAAARSQHTAPLAATIYNHLTAASTKRSTPM